MIIFCTISILLYVYYCIILSNPSCHKPIFKLLTNCYFLDSLWNSVAQRADYCRNIWKHDCFSGCFCFLFWPKRTMTYCSLWQVTREYWDWNLTIILIFCLLCMSFKTNTDCYSFHAYSTHYIVALEPNAKNSTDIHNPIE